MTTTPTQTRTRPQWAIVLAVGFFIAGFGVLLFGAGSALALAGLVSFGTGAVVAGAAVSLFGGAVYFLER